MEEEALLRPLVFSLSALVVWAAVGASPAGPTAHAATLTALVDPVDHRADGYDSAVARFDTARAAAAVAVPRQPPTVQDLIASAFAPLGEGAVDWAEKIAYCESKYDPNAVNPASNAEGLFQFLPSTWAGTPFATASPFDPGANAKAAAWLFQTYGPSQWECTA